MSKPNVIRVKPLHVKRELAAITRAMARPDLPATVRAELYGAQQALLWVYEENTMAPSKCALLGLPKESQ